ncbi:MAG: heparinase II/III family protein [Verrucomicrobiota bacterium]
MWKSLTVWLSASCLAHGALSDMPHPRLWLPISAEPALRETLRKDPLAAQLHQSILAEAGRILNARTCRYEIPDGKRLLAESRLALHNITQCAWAWRIEGGEPCRLRVIAELEAACALKDWNTSHYLDTAEMAAAVAIGYDWLYPTLTSTQRTMCERAIIDKALKPSKDAYGGKSQWWANKPRNNWSQVCGSGISLAAAAVAGHDEGLSENLFAAGLSLVNRCDAFYQPDGMYPEGPGYWHYGTDYHTMILAACQPLGVKVEEVPILRQAGAAIMHLTSPTRLNFNFADANAHVESPSPAQCWIASHFSDKVQARYVRNLFTRSLAESKGGSRGERVSVLSLLWLPADPGEVSLPNAAAFHGEQSVAIFRNSWDPKAAWFAIKGGTAAASHGHMDVGSFVYDIHGERWIHDLGSDNYNMPGYFGKNRWDYYRMQNRSHNTLEINGSLQTKDAKPCPLLSSCLTGPTPGASFDLSGAYRGVASKVVRSSTFDATTGAVRLNDEINAPNGPVVWRAFTDAQTEIRGNDVILTKKNHSITLRRISNTGIWTITDAKPPTAAENQNKGFRSIALTVPKADAVSIVVEIQP